MPWITIRNDAMDTATLDAFLAVADTGSSSRAAERLHLTQPAISERIATLAQQMDARTSERSATRMDLTEAGRAPRPRAELIINTLKDTARALGNLSATVQGRLQLGTSHHIGLHRLPPVLRRFTKAYP